MTRVIVCGGRAFPDRGLVFEVLDRLSVGSPTPLVVVHGGAHGADEHAAAWAAARGCQAIEFATDWETHGRAAGSMRSQEMVSAGADLLVAFPGGRGTADMVDRAIRAGIWVAQIPERRQTQ